MSFYEMGTAEVYAAGQRVAGQATAATTLAGQYLASLATAHDTVRHPVVVAALARYRDVWQPRVNEVAPQIDALGTNTGSSAVVVAHSDEDSNALLAQQGGLASEQGSTLLRPVNA
ncbi:MAG TPA: hypothetical protein VFM55_08595 [Micromonosporaceae bacterium]|nr:hypothetical protein [Micromonosporaceae bacterium]